MKGLIKYFGLLLLVLCVNCNNKQRESDNVAVTSPFSLSMEEAVQEFISYNLEQRFTGPRIFNIVPHFDKETNGLYLYFIMSRTYDENKTYYYYFGNDYLFTYVGSDTICMKGLVNFGNMIPFKDSIPGYESGIIYVDSNSNYDDIHTDNNMRYDDMAYRIIKVNGLDSLTVVHTDI